VRPQSEPAVRFGFLAIGAVALLVTGLVIGYLPRWRARIELVHRTEALSIPSVSVTNATKGRSSIGVPFSAEIRPWIEAPILARSSGYLKRWLVDLGTRVNQGDLLAEIETPEINQELDRARAELTQAEAALVLSKSTAERWTQLLKTASVAEQEAAEKQADFALKTATVEGAKASVRRLEELVSFARVLAPFPGVITRRNVDVGDLITAGSPHELFRLAQVQTLRVFVRVPQSMVSSAKLGTEASVIIGDSASRRVSAKIVRTAGVLEPESRTLLVELELDNSDGRILAGSFAQVVFAPDAIGDILVVPANTLLFRAEGVQVAILGKDDIVELRTIEVGRDFGASVEVRSGVSLEDRIILNPPDALSNGMHAQIAEDRKFGRENTNSSR